ncbi:MAG: class I SAM-dependent methyltransferase [Myxococcota bacterium]|nr:class I SAM-dependent methyltransferase [Myxococcota bacterium]
MSDLLFTGERLHKENPLFSIDLVRHRAAYSRAIELARTTGAERVLDLGCGTGYGTGELAAALPRTFAVDRISPDPGARHPAAHFIRADAAHLPLRTQSFDMIVSFQVIEHLEDPAPYLKAIARLLKPGGTALITTPNLLESDRENPFHVHEYEASELTALLGEHFSRVDMLGVSATPEPKAYYDARLKRIRSIVRLDPLGLRRRLPRWIIDGLFALFAVQVRRGIQKSDGLPQVGLEDFPILAAQPDCLDLFAVCQKPRRESGS